MLFVAHEGVASYALITQGVIFMLEALPVLGKWGQTHPLQQRWHLRSWCRPLWGLTLGCLRLFLETALAGEASLHKGPLLEQQLPPLGRGGWEQPLCSFAAASTYFEQEQKCQPSTPPARCPGSPHTPLFRVMLLRDGAVVWEGEGACVPLLGRSRAALGARPAVL